MPLTLKSSDPRHFTIEWRPWQASCLEGKKFSSIAPIPSLIWSAALWILVDSEVGTSVAR